MLQTFSKTEAIRFGWNTTKQNFWFFVGLLIVSVLVVIIPRLIGFFIRNAFGQPSPLDPTVIILPVGATIAFLFLSLGGGVLQIIVGIGLIRIVLTFCDNGKPRIADLFAGYRLFFQYLFGSMLYAVIVAGGIFLFIVPGFIWAFKFMFFSYFIVDKHIGPLEALHKSAEITKGAKWNLFLFAFLLSLINALGALVLLVGLFVTVPTTLVAMGFVYRKLLRQQELTQNPVSL